MKDIPKNQIPWESRTDLQADAPHRHEMENALERNMREVLSLATFVLGVLCFVAFVTAVKPNAFAAAEAPNKPAHCQTDDSQRRGCGLHLFAAASGFGQRW